MLCSVHPNVATHPGERSRIRSFLRQKRKTWVLRAKQLVRISVRLRHTVWLRTAAAAREFSISKRTVSSCAQIKRSSERRLHQKDSLSGDGPPSYDIRSSTYRIKCQMWQKLSGAPRSVETLMLFFLRPSHPEDSRASPSECKIGLRCKQQSACRHEQASSMRL